ncbi:MAG: tetratricopeptide repeat protein [Wohlfahrtiimonas sp.]
MRYLAVLLLSSTLLACTTTSGTSTSRKPSNSVTVENLPESDRLTYQMGVDYIGRGEYQVAHEKLMTLTKKYPNFSELYVMLGASQEFQGKKSDAIGYYSKAISINPMDRMAIKHYAMIQCGPYDQSAPEKLARIADNAPSELKAGMNSAAAACYLRHKNAIKGNEYADRAIAANPNYADTYYFKAIAVNELNRLNEVFPALDRYHDTYGYEPSSVYLGLNAAKKARNQSEISKYEGVIAMNQGQ